MINVEIKKIPESQIELKGEIPVEQFESFRPSAVKQISEKTEIPGFRKGKIPENILIQKLGEEKILYEMAERALDKLYPELIRNHNLDAIGQPKISITKIARGNPLGFSITVSVLPEIKLPEYKKIAKTIVEKKEPPVEVSEKEINDAVENIRSEVYKKDTVHKEGGTEQNSSNITKQLPEFNDEFVKKLGNYNDVVDFKAKLKQHLAKEKGLRSQEKRRSNILNDILLKTPLEIPKILIEEELSKMIIRLKSDIARMGASFEEYIKHIKKTEEEIRNEWTPDATKRVSFELILHAIAFAEKITPSEEDVAREIKHVLEHHRDADPERARLYVVGLLTNEKVLQFLEAQK